MDKVVHFEITYDNQNRAKGFYEKVFGWKIDSVPNMDYQMAITTKVDDKGMGAEIGAINGGMMKKDKTAPYPIVVVKVQKIEDAIKKVEANGGKVVMPTVPVGNMGLYVRVKDSEGNIIGIWQDLK